MCRLRTYSLYPLCLMLVGSLACGGADDSEPVSEDRDDTGAIGVVTDQPTNQAISPIDCSTVSAAAIVETGTASFSPETITIHKGEVVEWRNWRRRPVTVTSGDETHSGTSFDSGDIGVGDSYCLQFDITGTFPYYSRHQGSEVLSGKLRIDAAWRDER